MGKTAAAQAQVDKYGSYAQNPFQRVRAYNYVNQNPNSTLDDYYAKMGWKAPLPDAPGDFPPQYPVDPIKPPAPTPMNMRESLSKRVPVNPYTTY